jgi:hypothetical protein
MKLHLIKMKLMRIEVINRIHLRGINKIRGKSYSIIAAACNRGFLCWAIYDIPVTSDIFITF